MTEPTPSSQPATAVAAADAPTDLRSPTAVLWLSTAARLVMLIGIASLLVAAATLLVFGAVETYRQIVTLASPAGADLSSREVFLASITLVDLVVLATILQVVAFGIYALFIDSTIRVPEWLRTGTVDSLKNKLTGIVVVMLAVLFLEEVIHWCSERNLLPLGLAVAAVVVAVSYFIGKHSDKE